MLKEIYHRLNDFIPSACVVCHNSAITPLCKTCLAEILQVELACQQCGKQLFAKNEHLRCLDCIQSPPAFDAVYSMGTYDGVLKELILTAKIKRQATAVAALYYLIDKYSNKYPTPDTATYLQVMPTPKSRLIQRGFNLPQLLANRLIKNKADPQLIPIHSVKLPFFTHKQAAMNLTERQHYHHPFKLKKQVLLNKNTKISKNFIIFDDILTTGISAHQLAYLLKANGAKTVTVWAIARAQLK